MLFPAIICRYSTCKLQQPLTIRQPSPVFCWKCWSRNSRIGAQKFGNSSWKGYWQWHSSQHSRLNFQPLPASEKMLILFIAELHQTKAISTIHTYLAPPYSSRILQPTAGHPTSTSRTLRMQADQTTKAVTKTSNYPSRSLKNKSPSFRRIWGYLDLGGHVLWILWFSKGRRIYSKFKLLSSCSLVMPRYQHRLSHSSVSNQSTY